VYVNACEAISPAYASGATSDHLSMAMLYFLDEAKKLVNIPRGAGIVFDLVRQLGNYSYGDLDYDVPARYGDRPSDEIVDTMMQGLALPRYHEDPDWDFSSVLKALKRTAEYLEELGIKDYCVQTIAELACSESISLADTTSAMDVDG